MMKDQRAEQFRDLVGRLYTGGVPVNEVIYWLGKNGLHLVTYIKHLEDNQKPKPLTQRVLQGVGLYGWLLAHFAEMREYYESRRACPKTKRILSEREEFYSRGICPHCGHDDNSTITHSEKQIRLVYETTVFGICVDRQTDEWKPAWNTEEDA